MEAVDAAERINFDVSIDEIGNIYIYDPYMSRIQKFNNKGKHIKNIPIKEVSEGYYDKKIGRLVHKSLKTNIVAGKGKIYVRDTAKNRIEAIDESGNVVETIDIPEKIDGKDTREMKMWADEEGVGVGEKAVKGKKRWGEKVFVKQVNLKKLQIIQNNKSLNIIQNSPTAIGMQFRFMDNENNIYVNFFAPKGKENGIVKISNSGILLAKIHEGQYIFEKEWKDECGNQPKPIKNSWAESMVFDKKGNLYLFQTICCKAQKDCMGKIRILKISRGK